MPTRRPTDRRLIITLTPTVLDRLRSRGAQSDRHHGPYNYTRQLTRTLELYDAALVRSDPRETRGLPEAHYDLILDLLEEPERLEAFHIHRLGDYLLDLSDLAARARAAGADPGQLAAALNAMTFAEKLHLVDAAQIRSAPRISGPVAKPLPARAAGTRPLPARAANLAKTRPAKAAAKPPAAKPSAAKAPADRPSPASAPGAARGPGAAKRPRRA